VKAESVADGSFPEQPQNQRQNDADEQASDDGKMEAEIIL
jgi:hypothetical protein